MAMIKCPECGKEVSSMSQSCPGCGLNVLMYFNALDKANLKDLQNILPLKREQLKVKERELSSLEWKIRSLQETSRQDASASVQKPDVPIFGIKSTVFSLLIIIAFFVLVKSGYSNHLGDFIFMVFCIAVVVGLIFLVIGLVCIICYMHKRKKYNEYISDTETYKKKREYEITDAKTKLQDTDLFAKQSQLKREIETLKSEIPCLEKEARELISRVYPQENNPQCPTCGSEKIEKIGEFERYIDSTGFGTLAGGGINSRSLGKTFKCNNCGYRW